MVMITNGEKFFSVPAGSVKPYEGMGFHVMSDEEKKEMQHTHEKEHNNAVVDPIKDSGAIDDGDIDDGNKEEDTGSDMSEEEATFIEELLEKPLTQWIKEEVEEFVKIKDIDTSGAQKLSQVKSIIKAYLEEEQKNS